MAIGNLVETKNATFEDGFGKAAILAIWVTLKLDKKPNIGAGTITCNYDGINKFTTTIEEGAFYRLKQCFGRTGATLLTPNLSELSKSAAKPSARR